MCGSEGKLFRAMIEGSEMRVCNNCSKFGKVLGEVREEAKAVRKVKKVEIIEEPEVIEMVVSDFSMKVRNKREQIGLNQKDFAKKINEKESVVHKLENGEFSPSLDLARKLEKMFGISLIEEYEEKKEKIEKTAGEGITVGDLIRIKKR